MAKTISELRNQSIQVRDASAAGENTATRVGTVLNDIVGHIEDYENTQSSNNSSQDAKIEGVKSSLDAEIARAKTEESNLNTQIGTERTERQAAVSREETARIQADNDEKTARQQADNAEQDARIKADNDEKTARENADITLRTMIQTEVSNRQIAVKQEEIRAMAAEKANTQAIEDENARATTEEERLQGEVDNANDKLNSLDDKVNSNHYHFSDEVARLDLTDNEIKADLEAEKARATAAELDNTSAIEAVVVKNEEQDQKISELEGKLIENELVSYEITPANYNAYDGNKVWDSQQIFPVGVKLSKLKIASTGSVSPKNPRLYIVNDSNDIEDTIILNESVDVEDTEFDLTQYNIIVKDGYKYLVEACSNALAGSSLTGRYFYLSPDGFKNYDKYYFGFAFTYAVKNDKLKVLESKIEAEVAKNEEQDQKISELENKLSEKIITRLDAPDVVFTEFSNGLICYNSNLVLPVGHRLKKVILKGTGTENIRKTQLVIINTENTIEKTISFELYTADTEVDVSSENIFIQDGYKYCIAHPSNKFGRGSVSGYYIFSNGSFSEFNDYYLGFGFETEVVVSKFESMREEYTEGISVNSHRLDEIEIKGVGANLFNKYDEDIIRNKAFDKATGNIVDFSNAFITGYIPIKYGSKYSFTDNTSFLGSTYNRSVSLYDENKNFVGGYFYEVTHSDNVINTFTNNNESAKYARVVGYYSKIGSFMFVEGDALPTKYTPFGEYKYLNPLLFPIDYPFIRMFRKIAGIGDSLMSGCIQKTKTDAHDFNNMSWLSFIAYDSGAIATHYSTGGYTAKNWIDGDGGHKEKLASDPKSWAYFIGFGTNDADLSKASYPLGSIEDIAGADSFVGYYKQIVEYVHTQAPNAKIFCMSTYKITEPYGEMVGEIAKLYDYCYFIDVIKCSDVTLMSDSSYVCFDHFSTQGYIALAKNIIKEVNRIISDNMQDFVYIGYDNQYS